MKMRKPWKACSKKVRRSITCAAYPGWDQSWPPWSSARSTASSASPRLRSFVATPGCVLPPTAAGQGFSRQTTTTLQQMAPLGLRRGTLGCHRLLGLLRGLLQTQASPWQEAQPRHPGHGASDGSNHLAALDAAPGLREHQTQYLRSQPAERIACTGG